MSSVEAEGELVKVVIEMLLAYCTLVRTQQPSFQQRRHQMDSRQQLRRRFLLALQECDAVAIALPFQGIVSGPAVSVNHTARFNSFLDKRHQTLGRCIGDMPHANRSEERRVGKGCKV